MSSFKNDLVASHETQIVELNSELSTLAINNPLAEEVLNEVQFELFNYYEPILVYSYVVDFISSLLGSNEEKEEIINLLKKYLL
ncbi:hypothetical protein KKC17_03805 [Patescibacteria group bacterium]|nr:hypothetical protein [Patescibacteria group bacterium]